MYMNSLNKVQLIGNVTADPVVRKIGESRTVANFSIATNRTWKDSDGKKQDIAEFHNIVIWWKLAEIVEKYVTKWKKIYVEGRLQSSSWEDEEGVKRYKTEVVSDQMILLSPSKEMQERNHSDDDDNIVTAAERQGVSVPMWEDRVSIEDVPF